MEDSSGDDSDESSETDNDSGSDTKLLIVIMVLTQ